MVYMIPDTSSKNHSTEILYWVKYFSGALIATGVITIGIRKNTPILSLIGLLLVTGWVIYNIVTYEEPH